MMTGMFRDRTSAERAYNSLHSRGYTKDDVNIIMSDDTRKRHFTNVEHETELGNKALEGAGAGSPDEIPLVQELLVRAQHRQA